MASCKVGVQGRGETEKDRIDCPHTGRLELGQYVDLCSGIQRDHAGLSSKASGAHLETFKGNKKHRCDDWEMARLVT